MTAPRSGPNGFYSARLLVRDFARSWAFYRDVVRLTRAEVILTWLPGIFVGENHGDHQAAGVIATANPGCILQLRAGARLYGSGQRVVHVVELLDEAYRPA